MADNNRGQSSGSENRSEQESLKRREYRGPNGEIHHHTHTYMEQHGGGSDRDKGNRNNRENSDRKTR